eukprot:COSAG03_NODE_529_length_7125_cov_25.402220_8_plen_154_part_00
MYVIVYELLSRWEMDKATAAVNELYRTHTHVPVPTDDGNLTNVTVLTDDGNLTKKYESSCSAIGQDAELCEAAGCAVAASYCTAVKRIDPQEFFPVFVNFYSACEVCSPQPTASFEFSHSSLDTNTTPGYITGTIRTRASPSRCWGSTRSSRG